MLRMLLENPTSETFPDAARRLDAPHESSNGSA